MINDIIIEKNGNFLLDLTSEKNPIINVKKNVNITIDLLINEDTNLLTFFVQKYAKVMLRIFYKNSSELYRKYQLENTGRYNSMEN